jgi:uncharacterized protein YqgV (UPF0045/DUF77 family)
VDPSARRVFVAGWGAARHITIKLGTRTDRNQTMEDKVNSVKAKL